MLRISCRQQAQRGVCIYRFVAGAERIAARIGRRLRIGQCIVVPYIVARQIVSVDDAEAGA